MTAECSVGRREEGQATVEFVALLPVVAAIAVAISIFLAGQRAAEAADQAAIAAAVAQVQGADPRAAVRSAAPGWTRPQLTIRGGRVRVRLRWKAPAPLTGLVDVDRAVAFSPLATRR